MAPGVTRAKKGYVVMVGQNMLPLLAILLMLHQRLFMWFNECGFHEVLKTKNVIAVVGYYYVITKLYIENLLRNVEDDRLRPNSVRF